MLLSVAPLWRLSRASRASSLLVHRALSCSAVCPAKHNLPAFSARTRFAPSPTGYLHLGSLRTALFNYLLAKKTGGQFLLRIEDTDEKRTVPDAEQKLCEDLQWAGLQWDEGPDTKGKLGPYRQSERTLLYQQHAQKLLDSGHAYRCFCPAERLEQLAKQRKELGLPTDYDRQCAGIPKEQSDEKAAKGDGFVVRLLAPELYPDFVDLIYGKIGKDKGDNAGVTVKYGEIAYEDPVLLKTDGRPTYHLANVVDDHFMEITHVVRATEWISSTPKHLALYQAFGWEPPKFAHVGLLVDADGHKLSKRNFDTTIKSFRDMGIIPSALINFVALLGWSHAQRSDIMDLNELIEQFQMKFTKGNTTVTLDKLWYLQRAHALKMAETESPVLQEITEKTCTAVKETLGVHECPSGHPLQPYVESLLRLDAKNYTTPAAFCERNVHFFREPIWSSYRNENPAVARTTELRKATQVLLATPDDTWSSETLSTRMKTILFDATQSSPSDAKEPSDPKMHEKAWNRSFCDYLRWVLMGGRPGPSLVATLAMLGPEVCRRRFEMACSFRPD